MNRLTSEIDVGSGSYAGMILADNPLGYWRLGEQVGPTAGDQSGNGYDGTYTGVLSFGEPGLAVAIDTAVGIAAVGGGYVRGPTLTGTTLTGAEVWFETESLHSTYGMTFFSLYKYPSSYTRMFITHLPDGKIAVYRNRSSKEITSDSVISIGEPHHVAVWYESASNTTYMMIDGVVQQDTYIGNLLATPDPEVLIAAFRYYNTLYTRYIGVVDEVAIYDGTVNATMFANHSTGGHDGLQFAYDANGNRTSLDDGSAVTTYGYDVASNRLNAIAAASVQLDAAGNWTGDPGGVRTYEYSDANRLDAVKDNGITTATYAHNALGQRVNKTVGGTTTVYVYDVNGNLLAEHDANGADIRDYVWMNGAPIAQVDAGESFSYLHFDHLGTPRIATDDTQTVVWRWESDAFGASAANDDPDGNGTPLTVNLRSPGQYYDVETGFHYNYFRTLDPATGRYLESDPIGLLGGPNTYAYALGNPISLYDPYGLWVPPSLPQGFVDGVTGFGDSFLGISKYVRNKFDIDGGVDPCSTAYRGGKVAGIVVGTAPFALRGAAYLGSTRFGHLLNHNRYLRIGPGRMPAAGRGLPSGTHVPRLSIGPQVKGGPPNPHFDLRSRFPYVPPISESDDCSCQR